MELNIVCAVAGGHPREQIKLLCSFARPGRYDWVISIESEETECYVSEIRLFTRNLVTKAKQVVAHPDEPAPDRADGFANWTMLALHALRIELSKSYCVTLDLLSEMPGVLEKSNLHGFLITPFSAPVFTLQ